MTKWIPCGRHFIEADVIRWLEPAWKPKTRKSAKGVMVGSRIITAQVEACGPEWVDLKVISCETTAFEGWLVDNLKPAERLHRKRGPLGRAEAGTVRREWSDESARAAVASRFLNPGEDGPDRANAPVKATHAGHSKPPRRAGTGRRGY